MFLLFAQTSLTELYLRNRIDQLTIIWGEVPGWKGVASMRLGMSKCRGGTSKTSILSLHWQNILLNTYSRRTYICWTERQVKRKNYFDLYLCTTFWHIRCAKHRIRPHHRLTHILGNHMQRRGGASTELRERGRGGKRRAEAATMEEYSLLSYWRHLTAGAGHQNMCTQMQFMGFDAF